MKTRRSILSLFFGAAAAPAAVAVARAMPELPMSALSLPDVEQLHQMQRRFAEAVDKMVRSYYDFPSFRGVPIHVVDEIAND